MRRVCIWCGSFHKGELYRCPECARLSWAFEFPEVFGGVGRVTSEGAVKDLCPVSSFDLREVVQEI